MNPSLDPIFHSLADPTRRMIVSQLTRGSASVTDLARPGTVQLPTFLKHLKVLEDAGLIETRKRGRVRTCTLRPLALTHAQRWLAAQREVWEQRTDRMVAFVENEERGAS